MTRSLDRSPMGQYDVATMSKELAEVVREILDRVPGSDRELSQAADVPPSTISRIRNGQRGCTREVADALAEVLARWSDDCQKAAHDLRRALQTREADDE